MVDFIKKEWEPEDGQEITVRDRKYNVQALIHVARNLPVKEMPLAEMYIDYYSPGKNSLRSFVGHMQMVLDADLQYPIILNQDGALLDGMHRLAKALLLGHDTIKVVRFNVDPPAAYYVV